MSRKQTLFFFAVVAILLGVLWGMAHADEPMLFPRLHRWKIVETTFDIHRNEVVSEKVLSWDFDTADECNQVITGIISRPEDGKVVFYSCTHDNTEISQ